MNRLKERLDRALAGVEITPVLEERIMKGRVRKVRRKLTIVLTAALVLLLAAGIAYATGVFTSIFDGMKGMYVNGDDEKYEAMDGLSNAGSASEALTAAPGATLSVKQTYYDGEQLALGYTVEGIAAADMSFGPAHPEFEEFRKAVMGEAGAAAVYFNELLSDEEYALYEKTLNETGAAGFICQYVYLGDGVSLADGTEMTSYVNTAVEGGTYIEFETPLPDAARDKDSLSLVLNVRTQNLYYYRDATGSYVMTGPMQAQDVIVEVPRSTDRVNWYEGSYESELYSAAARLLVTPINARATIEMKIPAEWMIPWDSMDELVESGTDILVDYVLVVDGTSREGDLSEQVGADGRTLSLAFAPPPDGATTLSLRPVYAVSGEHPNEDIILK